MNASKFPPNHSADANNLAIDFDGVIHNDNRGWHDGTCYGEPIPGALESIKTLASKYRIVIFTAKAKPDRPLVDGKTGKQLVEEWLNKYGVLQYVQEITSEKPRAMLYIDDNAYRFTNWTDTMSFVNHNVQSI